MIKWCCQVPKRFSKRKLQGVNTKTNRPIHPQPTSSKTYNPYDVLVPFTSVFLLELTVNTCRKKERPPTTLMAILNLRARSRGHASTNQTFFASEVPFVSNSAFYCPTDHRPKVHLECQRIQQCKRTVEWKYLWYRSTFGGPVESRSLDRRECSQKSALPLGTQHCTKKNKIII